MGCLRHADVNQCLGAILEAHQRGDSARIAKASAGIQGARNRVEQGEFPHRVVAECISVAQQLTNVPAAIHAPEAEVVSTIDSFTFHFREEEWSTGRQGEVIERCKLRTRFEAGRIGRSFARSCNEIDRAANAEPQARFVAAIDSSTLEGGEEGVTVARSGNRIAQTREVCPSGSRCVASFTSQDGETAPGWAGNDRAVIVVCHSTEAGLQLGKGRVVESIGCLLYTSPSPRDGLLSRMPSSA